MADQRILASEYLIGANHPTLTDTLNRLTLIEHNTDGSHKYPQVLVTNHLSGLAMSHAADTDHDITIAAGKARDATDSVDMVLASAITKLFDAEWAVGSTNGGFAAGESLPASGTIHIWLIKRSDTGVVDVLANNHATTALSPTLPANYDYKRRIGSYRTNGSNNIINGDWWGTGLVRTFMYDSPILDYTTANCGTSASSLALSVPTGIVVKALMNIWATNGIYVSALVSTDMAASNSVAPLLNSGYRGDNCWAFTNTSSQIRRRSLSDEAQYMVTVGWEDSL